MDSKVGVVLIGRNEGERFRRCLASIESSSAPVVYVDSGSTDGSVEWARSRGAAVVELDPGVPFTAARARNAGLEQLLAVHPDLEFVQFVDGDCEVVASWLARAAAELRDHPERAVVCGRRRERYPERTVYNLMCDVEWNTPIGEAASCGGDSMMRVAALRAVGGFNPALIAGEEPELCVRLRAAGWKIFRVDADMTIHDAAVTRIGQWWRRSVRCGYGYADGFARHGRPPERLYARQLRSAAFSAVVVPALALGLAPVTWGLSLGLFAWYPVRIGRYALSLQRRGIEPRAAWPYAAFCSLGDVPLLVGVLRYVRMRMAGRRSTLIEYKGAAE